MQRLPVAVLGLSVLVSPAFAQGSDTCSSTPLLTNYGTHAWSNTSATTGPEAPPACVTAIHRDVWFRWRSPFTEYVELKTCGLTSVNTVLAVYDGSVCPTAAAIVCNDDACATQSSVKFPAVQNFEYLIRIGQKVDGPGGSGTFDILVTDSPACGPNVGPDLKVSDVQNLANHVAVNGLDAVSLATTVCNVGSTYVDALDTTDHPILASNLYRYETVEGASRFEQIGMSWLKHDNTVQPETSCCTCYSNLQWRLAVGCSDLNSSATNGEQALLGPRWQVNASNAFFPYPPANPPIPQSTSRRLEYLTTDVRATSDKVLYIGEVQCMTPDETNDVTRNNDASWRQMTATGGPGDSTFSFVGPTQPMQSAIRAWPQLDPAVLLSDVKVAGDGLFVVGSRAYPLADGRWRYEYAVYNMNSHRGCGAFSIPVPSSTTVTNAGFHGVVYRNGDGPGSVNVSSADWSFLVAGGFATWTTETVAQNASANAIRWGTTYNFRFDCATPPAQANASLGLWRTGSPATIEAAVLVPSPAMSNATCFGDGTGTACPCGNNGPAGQGCLNSLGLGGTLAATGTPSVANDTLVLSGTRMPNSTCLYFQGTTSAGGGAGLLFGDGLRCVAGTIVRLATKVNTLGSSSYPGPGDASVSVRGSCAPGNVRHYQGWYRNAASYCTPSTFNLTNGWSVTWQL